MNEFQMLLVLGFPPELAAAVVMPGVFLAADNASAPTAGQIFRR